MMDRLYNDVNPLHFHGYIRHCVLSASYRAMVMYMRGCCVPGVIVAYPNSSQPPENCS